MSNKQMLEQEISNLNKILKICGDSKRNNGKN